MFSRNYKRLSMPKVRKERQEQKVRVALEEEEDICKSFMLAALFASLDISMVTG